jgi:hypothetical protein
MLVHQPITLTFGELYADPTRNPFGEDEDEEEDEI